MAKEIILRAGFVVLVSEEDYERVVSFGRWRPFVPKRNTWYATAGEETVRMHRFILGLERHDPRLVDHIDGNGWNNVRENLRICTRSENQRNHARFKTNTSGIPGVSFDKKSARWAAYVWVNNKKLSLGYFSEKELAGESVRVARLKYHGEFARHDVRAE